jgi:predicted ester cyclase
MDTTQKNKEIVLRFNKEFIEKNNAEVLKEIVADGFINHTAPANFPKDVTGLVQFIGTLHKGFSDLSIDIHEQVGEGDMVATRKTIYGTHTGEIMGKAGTGKKVVLTVMDFVRVQDGKYTDHWGQNNIMQVIQSL